jgi:hypothetical protein
MCTPPAGCCAWPERILIVPTTQHPALAFTNHLLGNFLMHKNSNFVAVPDFIADCVCLPIRALLRSPLVLGFHKIDGFDLADEKDTFFTQPCKGYLLHCCVEPHRICRNNL